MPENVKGPETAAICGLKLSKWFAELRQNFVFSRTSLGYYPPVTSEKSSKTWPKAGMVYDGEFYPQPNWERRISVIASGLLHTPTVYDAQGIKRSLEGWEKRAAFRKSIGRDHIAPAGLSEQIWLEENNIPLMISKWPTPTVDDANNVSRKSGQYQSLSRVFFQATDGGTLNPRFVEWLMGMPEGHLNLEPLEMPKFLKWRQQRGDYLLENKS